MEKNTLTFPLMERLVENHNDENHIATQEEIKQKYIKSVENNITEIIGTRCTNQELIASFKDDNNSSRYDMIRYSAPFFGIQALDGKYIQQQDVKEIIEQISYTILKFEPRINKIKISKDRSNTKNHINNKQTLKLNIDFELKNNHEKHSFATTLKPR